MLRPPVRPSAPVKKERAKNTRLTLRRVWHYLRRQRGGLLLVSIVTILSGICGLLGPYLIGSAIDTYIIPRDASGLFGLCLLLLVIYAAGSALSWIQVYIMSGVSQRTVWELRKDLFAHLQKLPVRFYDQSTQGELMSRTTNDVENVANSLNQSVTQLITSSMTLVGSLIIMLFLNVPLTLVVLLSIPLVLYTTKQISRRTQKLFKEQQQQLGKLNSMIEETVAGQKVVKTYRQEAASVMQLSGVNQRLRQAGTSAQIFSGLMGPCMNMLNHMRFILIAAIGGWMALNGWTTIGIIVSFLNYSRQFGAPLNDIANQYNLIQSGVAGAERVFEILDTETEYESDQQAGTLPRIKGEVAFEHVSFSYLNDQQTLRDVSFAARPGDLIALVGPTGAGKTTIANLLTRFYEYGEGTITIDGEDIRRLAKDGLRSRIGFVLQDVYLFSDTVRENIRFGRLDATDAEVEEAARLANADSFIRKLPQGYDTRLTAEAGNLSQGQRQLLTIARAILADPAILILDEATSSVDTRTEAHIQEAMRTLMQGRTSFVIAHRLSTIRDADTILVIRGGEIAERGTHEELLARKGFYYALYASQFQQVV